MPSSPFQTFLGVPHVFLDDVGAGDIVILGIPETTPYTPGKPSHSRDAPGAIRSALARLEDWAGHINFDVGAPLIRDDGRRIVDAGDLPGDPTTPEENRRRITEAITQITAREFHSDGIAGAAEAVPEGARCFLTIDCDGLDPAVIPAVESQAPGGLTYWHVVELIETLCCRTLLVGFDLVELAPQRDVNGLGTRTAGRIICNLLGNCSNTPVS